MMSMLMTVMEDESKNLIKVLYHQINHLYLSLLFAVFLSILDKIHHRSLIIKPSNLPVIIFLGLLVVHIYCNHNQSINPSFLLVLYLYLSLEILLAFGATLARVMLGAELEPQSNEPYLSTSLQDFWGKRWNLMVSSILRPTVYHPVRHISSHIFGRNWASVPAVLATFVVSSLMHALIFYYMHSMEPTWEATFLLCYPWDLYGHGGWNEESIEWKMAVTSFS
ncbi:hypothetical protein C5167_005943 [Papaver somniferum]|uniref:Wax synthase domain-containing protein n=1 Tax=Papaver somniferum TaxID=3469 RepID=A0A4Y7JCU6_PAPSO|nr:hypothetical protein C5167_005943 [Papaver somniferum]